MLKRIPYDPAFVPRWIAGFTSFTVSVHDENGRLLASESRAGLPAHVDLLPKVVRVRFNGIRLRTGLGIRVAQNGGGEEFCDENNLAAARDR